MEPHWISALAYLWQWLSFISFCRCLRSAQI